MGAQDFSQRAKGKTAKEAFKAAREQASWEHGHGGYTGSLAETNEFTVIPLPEGRAPSEYADELIMPRTIERTVYEFSELSERAKNKARDDARYCNVDHDDWWDCTYEDAIAVAALMGIDIGRDGKRPAIHFSGFCSQGDGASFSGWYNYKEDSVTNVRAHAPKDEELIAIAEGLVVMQTTARLVHGGRLYARIETSGHYSHSGTMSADDVTYADTEGEAPHCPDEVANDLLALFRRFADWIYAQLEAEHDYLTSNSYIDEYLNEEEFDEDGSII